MRCLHIHRLAGQGVDNLFGVEVLLSTSIFCEQLAGTVSKQLMVRNLELKGSRIPGVVQLNVIRVDESDGDA